MLDRRLFSERAAGRRRCARARAREFTVYLHERVPPGDGGIALGQAVVAGGDRAAVDGREKGAHMCLGVPGKVVSRSTA